MDDILLKDEPSVPINQKYIVYAATEGEENQTVCCIQVYNGDDFPTVHKYERLALWHVQFVSRPWHRTLLMSFI